VEQFRDQLQRKDLVQEVLSDDVLGLHRDAAANGQWHQNRKRRPVEPGSIHGGPPLSAIRIEGARHQSQKCTLYRGNNHGMARAAVGDSRAPIMPSTVEAKTMTTITPIARSMARLRVRPTLAPM